MKAIIALATATIATITGLAALLSTGRLTLDFGWGRRLRPLGPRRARIAGPREQVFDLIALPYLSPEQATHALRKKIEVLERSKDMVIAAHRTKVGRITTTTVEAVSFSRPEKIAFRLLRGPVPFVTEEFVLHEVAEGRTTEVVYTGEMGTDLWTVGEWWGDLVARYWERAVADALASLERTPDSVLARASARRASSAGR